ncbi:MAG: GNAT family N-acyltransferase [Candidatus Omnitrophota bacterium]|nr:GNAT family N-acyltransferase [Candidatus Omnitrophota bacterium]
MITNVPKNIMIPPVLVETGQFMVKLAENHEEVEKAQRLRYEVFNIEQGRGLEISERYGIDFDEFDEYCLHLLVMKKNTGRVIGTYRAHLGSVANSAKGFYSSREYQIRGLYRIADKCIELGRTCVSPEFRSGAVVALLWGAISELLNRAKLSYMLGCVSLEETDPKTGWALYEYLRQSYSVHTDFSVKPRPGFVLKKPPDHEIKKILADKDALRKHIPPIFKGYLRLGARICGEPALDREFGTIDFFILVDINNVPQRYLRHFRYKEKQD